MVVTSRLEIVHHYLDATTGKHLAVAMSTGEKETIEVVSSVEKVITKLTIQHMELPSLGNHPRHKLLIL